MELLQVRFHPLCPEILASGSLDHEVRLWDANTAECIGSRDFCNYFSALCLHFWYKLLFFPIISRISELPIMFLPTDRPIASIAFHAQGELLAVASGHKVKNRHSSMFFRFVFDVLWWLMAYLGICVSYIYGTTTGEGTHPHQPLFWRHVVRSGQCIFIHMVPLFYWLLR